MKQGTSENGIWPTGIQSPSMPALVMTIGWLPIHWNLLRMLIILVCTITKANPSNFPATGLTRWLTQLLGIWISPETAVISYSYLLLNRITRIIWIIILLPMDMRNVIPAVGAPPILQLWEEVRHSTLAAIAVWLKNWMKPWAV